MRDETAALAERLLELTQAQGQCLAAQDWEGFARLANERIAVTERLRPQAATRPDLRAALVKVAELDAVHDGLLAAAHADLEREWHQVLPQQSAVMAYFQGDVPLANEARFLDRRD